ncbi:MAG: caffeoyl-CoA O-methyltransferase, partial [Candidatus Poriferisodalaceae bacterium]
MQISREQGVLLRTLIHLAQPQLAIEIGTFTGYSALMMAQALPEGGRLLCCDVSE